MPSSSTDSGCGAASTAAPSQHPAFLVGSQTFHPLPERALWHAESKTIFVADAHFGKSAIFRAGGIAIPGGTSAHDLRRLGDLAAATGAAEIIFLGDTLHAPGVRDTAVLEQLRDWARGLKCTLRAIPGNHDLRAHELLSSAGFSIFPEGTLWHGIRLLHEPGAAADPSLCGHLHPGVVCHGRGAQRLRLPCFWLCGQRCCLPAFGSFTGLHPIGRHDGGRCFAVADSLILEVIPGSRRTSAGKKV